MSYNPNERYTPLMNNKPFNKRATHNFSLIELLLVASVLALLMTLLSPSLREMLSKTRTLQCANNQRQLGQHLFQYSEDYDDQLMPVFQSKQFGYQTWGEHLAVYLGYEKTYHPIPQNKMGPFKCPENDLQRYYNSTRSYSEYDTSYSANSWRIDRIVNTFGHGNHPFGSKTFEWDQPSKLGLLLENKYYRIAPWYSDGTGSIPLPLSGSLRYMRYSHSKGTCNVLYGDLHVSVTDFVPYRGNVIDHSAPSDSASRYKNGPFFYIK